MTFKDFFTEKLALKGDYKGGIFQRLVAAKYVTMPRHTEEHRGAWEELIRKFQRQKEFLSRDFDMEPIDGDPYRSMKHMTNSINQQKAAGQKPNVKVYATPPSGAEDDPTAAIGHPIFTNDQNVDVRWIHDIIAHYYGQHKFSARGEYAAYNRHTKTLGPNTLASEAMFTEVVAQTSCYYVLGDFVEQKTTLMTDDFDHINIGALAPGSSLNKYFVLENKTLIKRPDFNGEALMQERPALSKELMRQVSAGKSLVPLESIF